MIKKKSLLISTVLIVSFLLLALAGCFWNTAILDQIEVETAPKTVYRLGESLEIDGGVLKATYSDGGSGLVAFTDERVSFSELDKNKAGEQVITVRFDTQYTVYTVTVLDVASTVELIENPLKSSYIQGERFDVRGAKVKILHEGGVEKTVELTQTMLEAAGSVFSVRGFDAEKVGEATVQIVFFNHETEFLMPFTVIVRKKQVTGFTLTQKPDSKTNYERGAELELDGLKFRIAYDNNVPLDATIEQTDEGKYVLRDSSGNVLEGEVKLFTLDGNRRIEGFENATTGSKELVFSYLTENGGDLASHDAYGLKVNVVEKAIANSIYIGVDQLIKGMPVEFLADFLKGSTIEIRYTDDTSKIFRFPEDAVGEDKKVEILGYDPDSTADMQVLTFDFGADGRIERTFKMIERAVTGLEPTDTGDYDVGEAKLSFYTGDVLDVSAWRFALQYSNGTEDLYYGRNLTITTDLPAGDADYYTARFEFSTPGDYTVTFGYVGMATYSLNVAVYEKTLSDLVVEKLPDLIEYSVGDTISLAGLRLRADYIDPLTGAVVRSRIVLNTELSVDYDNTISGTQSVTLGLTENGIARSAVFSVSFKALVTGIEIESAVDTDYVKGEKFNPEGTVVLIRFDGAPDERVTLGEINEGGAWTFAPAVLNEVGSVSVTIGYMGKNAVIDVTVHNNVAKFILRDADGTEYERNATVGEITVGIAVAEKLKGWTFAAVRENAETEVFVLPNDNVSVTADNSQSWEQEKKLEVRFRYLGEEGLFYMDRLQRKHSYYELFGSPQGLQTAAAGFQSNGLSLREYFDNGTLELLAEGAQYTFVVPKITFPEGGDRVEVAVGIRLQDNTLIRFRWGAAGEISAFPVTFYEKIATKISWKELPSEDFKIDEGTPADEVLKLLANAVTISGDPIRVVATYSDNTTSEIVLKDHLTDFSIKNYDPTLPDNHSIALYYSLGANVSVDLVLRINPRILVSVKAEGYLVGALGATEEGTVVEGTDLDYTKAYLSVVYGYADGDALKQTTVNVPIQSSWSDFDKYKTYTKTDNKVVITYRYRGSEKSVLYKIVTVGKEVDEVSLMTSPKNAFTEGENFTFETLSGGDYGVLRVGYNNGSYKTLSLDPKNQYVEGMTDAESYYNVVSNGMTDYFASKGGYDKVELIDGGTKTFVVVLRYMNRTVQYQVVLKDRASVTFDYQMEGASEKLYGDPIAVTLFVLSDGATVTEGGRSVAYRKENGAVYVPRDDGFYLGDTAYRYLPAGSYTIEAHFGGVPIRYNPAEKDVGTFNVSKRTLVLSYGAIDSVVYGDPTPDFIANNLSCEGFVAEETLANLAGTLSFTAFLNGIRLDGAPVNANLDGAYYEIGAEGLTSDNYDLVWPGERNNPFGLFRIDPLPVYVDFTEQTVIYGSAIPNVGYTAYRANADGTNSGTLLEENYLSQLTGAPDAYLQGVNLDDDSVMAVQPNAGRYELNVAVMGGENPNFKITAPEGRFVWINRAPLKVSYNAKSVVYGDSIVFSDVSSNLVIEGWKRNDEGNVSFEVGFALNGAGDYLNGDALVAAMKNAGQYTLTAGNLSFDNYEVDPADVADGVFTVAPKSVVVTPQTARKTYGTADPVLEYRADGLIEGDRLQGQLQREAGEDVMDEGYRILLGTLSNPNYALKLAEETVFFNVSKRELILSVNEEKLRKFYDGYAPSIDEYTLTLADGGAVADETVYIDGTAPDKEKIALTFSSLLPDRTLATAPLKVLLNNRDRNHTVALATEYKYAIDRLPVEIEWLKRTLDGTAFMPFSSGSSYPYIYGGKHYIAARVKIPDGATVNPDVLTDENRAVSLSSAFDQYYDKATDCYGISKAETYAPAVTESGVKNSNFTLSNQALASTRIVVEPNTVYVALGVSARSKDYDRATASVSTQNLADVTLYERETDELGAIVIGSTDPKLIVDEDYKKAVVRILNFKVGTKSNGVSDVATDTPDRSYPIAMSVSDPTLGSNFRAEFKNDESQKYFIYPRKISITVYGAKQKVYDGDAPFIAASDLSSSDASYVTSSQLQDMILFAAKDASIGTIDKMGDVGDYGLSVDAEKNANYDIAFVEEYTYKIVKKEISVTLTEGSGYYNGDKQLTLEAADVKARDNNLGRGDLWEDVFPAMQNSFAFLYLDNTGFDGLSIGNESGQRGNVGDYTLTLQMGTAIHKNYTFVWSGQTTFTVKPAEVSILPQRTSSVYGSEEGDLAVYFKSFTPVFEKGSDGADGSVFLSSATVQSFLTLSRSNPDVLNVGYYNVGLSELWTKDSVDGVRPDFPNYRVSLSDYDGANRFQITKRPLTVKIGDYKKTFGTSVTNADLQVAFPRLAEELKTDGAYSDTLASILASYGLTERAEGIYSFAENVSYRYTFKGAAGDASALPTDALANSTRGGDRYEIEFANLPNMQNYEFVYADGVSIFEIQPKTLEITASDFDWTYRDAWQTGAAETDETKLNFGNFFKVDGKIPGDTSELKYPLLATDAGFASAYRLLTEGDAGSAAPIGLDWFDTAGTNDVSRNRNYVYDFSKLTGAETARVAKAELRAIVTDAAGGHEIERVYGELPNKSELRIVYSGFRGADEETYRTSPAEVIASEAEIPNFVQSLTPSGSGNPTALLYGVGKHRIDPDKTGFSAKNYELTTDAATTENALTFVVTKRLLQVKSAPVADGDAVLRKFFGTSLERDTDYEVSFTGFITSVTLPDGSEAAVADNAESEFYDGYPSAEWVSYETAVNVVRNGESPTEITPNVALMNQISNNYDVAAAEGESLRLAIYNRIASVETANKIGDGYYAYVVNKARSADANLVRVKVSYIDGTSDYVDLPLSATEEAFPTDLHTLYFGVQNYVAAVNTNQTVLISVREDNDLIETGSDRKSLSLTVRDVTSADYTADSNDLNATFIGTPLDARTGAIERELSYATGAAETAVRFNLLDVSFLLMRTKAGGAFDVVFYNAKSKADASYRYILRFTTDNTTGGLQFFAQPKLEDGTFDTSVAASDQHRLNTIDVFDEALHTARLFYNKLTDVIHLEIDGVLFMSFNVPAGGTLQGAAGESLASFALDKAYGYVMSATLTCEGYSAEDAVRIVAKSEAQRVLRLGLEPFVGISPNEYFGFLWNYAKDFYGDLTYGAPNVQYLIDGALTQLNGEGKLMLSAGSYRITAKAYRGTMLLSEKTVEIGVVDGFALDGYVYESDGERINIAPRVDNPAALYATNDGGRTYSGVVANQDFSHYRLDAGAFDLAESLPAAYTRAIEINLKTSDSAQTAFTAPEGSNDYTGLTLGIVRRDNVYTTSLKLVAGDGTRSVRPEVQSTSAIDWTRKDGIYSVDATFDRKNLYIRAEVLFNNESLYIFYLDGAVAGANPGDQDAETATGRADVDNLDEMYNKTPNSWAVAMLANLPGGHSVNLETSTGVTVLRVTLDTYADVRDGFVKTESYTHNNLTTLTPSYVPASQNGVDASMAAAGRESSFMLGQNNFAEPNSKSVRAGVYRYETYGVRFAANPVSGMTNKLRFILAENAPKTATDDANRYSAKAMRNVSLTFLRKTGENTRLFFSFNDAVYNTGMSLDEVGEVKNVRYEQEVYSFPAGTPGENQIDLFDGKEHEILVTFDRKENNVELSSGLVAQVTLANFVKIRIDGIWVGGQFLFPEYNNVSPWYYTDESGNRQAVPQSTAPFYDRYFLDEKTSAGLAFRGIDIKILALGVSEKSDHLNFLS